MKKGQYKLSQLFAATTLIAIILVFLKRPISCIEPAAMIHTMIHGFIAPWTWILWFFNIDVNFGHSWFSCSRWLLLPALISIVAQAICVVLFAYFMFSLSHYVFCGKWPDPPPNNPGKKE